MQEFQNHGVSALKGKNENFRDNLVFDFKDTNKNMIIYVENQEETILKDYKGLEYKVHDITGCSIIPTTYILGKSEEYLNLITDESSNRAIYKE